jgi:phosphate transport system substrate-binding protein
MNDDFLKSLRRPPPAAFERQLRARLREQEINETSRRRPSWKLLAIAMLIGGSALATATYLTLSRTGLLSSPATQTQADHAPQGAPTSGQDAVPVINQWRTDETDAEFSTDGSSAPSAQSQSPLGAARDNNKSLTDPSQSGSTETSRYVSSTGPGGSASTRPVRVILTPDIERLARDTSPGSGHSAGLSFEVDSADAALPTLCAKEDEDQPDVIVTSRRARKDEFMLCKRPHYNGEVRETTLGHVATVVTRAKAGMPMQLPPRILRRALMKQVPAPGNPARLIDNPYTHWNQIDPELEDRRIEVLGPERNSLEFIVFAATLLAPACEDNASLDRQLCQTVREDGVYVEVRFDNTFVRQRLWSDPNVVAVMDYRFYEANSADLVGSLLPGPAPTRESIINGTYVGARPLHVYVNGVRYRYNRSVNSLINEYLRLPAYLYGKALIRPDSEESRRYLWETPKLTEVKLD